MDPYRLPNTETEDVNLNPIQISWKKNGFPNIRISTRYDWRMATGCLGDIWRLQRLGDLKTRHFDTQKSANNGLGTSVIGRWLV